MNLVIQNVVAAWSLSPESKINEKLISARSWTKFNGLILRPLGLASANYMAVSALFT